MDSAFRIRPAVPSDIESIHLLERAIESAPHWALAEYLAALSPADHRAGAAGASRCLFVADNGSGIIGFAVGKVTVLESEVDAELESVAVAESARRVGMGRALCTAVIEWCRRQGALELMLEVRSRSSGPVNLYQRLGFLPVGLRKDYYRNPIDDAVLMRLSLEPDHTLKTRPDRDL